MNNDDLASVTRRDAAQIGSKACSADRNAAVARARREGVAAEHEAMLWEIVEMVTESLDAPEARFSLREAGDLIVKAIRERDRVSSRRRRGGSMMEVRDEVRWFAEAMEAELKANDHKGGWDQDQPNALLHRLLEEAQELKEVLDREAWTLDVYSPADPLPAETLTRIRKEAADVANFAMMVADVCGALK